ncbi:MAG: LemA family protein [Candidatus Woesearchaeota archaeon]
MARIVTLFLFLLCFSVFLFFAHALFAPVIAALSVLLLIFLITQYNSFVNLEEAVNKSWADIDADLQQRSDLSARLVEILRSYMKHEHSTLEDVTNARKQFSEAKTLNEKIDSAGKFEDVMGKLLVVAEQYPNLKADASFNRMVDTLTDLEENISESRKEFNRSVRNYNVTSKSFPANMAFMVMGAKAINYFNTGENSKMSSRLDFDDTERNKVLPGNICPKCNSMVSENARFCRSCGTKVS